MRLLLVPLEHSFTAIRDHMKAHSDDDVPAPEQMREMAKLAVRFVMTVRALEPYAEAVRRNPSEN